MEFALVAPILFALVFGIFDFGRCMSANVTVTNSAREGARWAATHTTSWQTPVGGIPAGELRYYFQCPTATSPPGAPDQRGAPGQAWRQLQAANLDLTQVSYVVSYYMSTNDPAVAGSKPDYKQSCVNGVATETGHDGTSSVNYTAGSGDWVKVEVVYNYAPVTPFISALIHTVTIDQTSTMVLE